MGMDKRVYQRFKIDCPAKCSYFDTFPESFPIIIIDFGPEGVGFISTESMSIGTSIYLLMELEKGQSIKFIAKVRWCKAVPNSTQYNIGVKITDANDKDMEQFIKFYCKQLIPRNYKKRKIQVIVQDKTSSKKLQESLAKCDYDVVCSFDGDNGFNQYLTEKPDLIIMDMALSKIKGYEVCRKIRRLQNDQKTSIIMLVAKKKDITSLDGGPVEVNKYFIKPFDMDRMLQDISALLSVPED